MPLESDRVRKLIERGLEQYGRGRLAEAIAEWERALAIDERNAEARGLIAFVREKLGAVEGQVVPWGADFVAVAPETDGQGRTGWGLAADPVPREVPSPEAEVGSEGSEDRDAGSDGRNPAWQGRGKVEAVSEPAETSGSAFQTAESTTDPGPEAMASALDELDWSDVNPDGRAPGEGREAPAEAAPPAGQRGQRITRESPIPAMLAAHMPEPSDPQMPNADPNEWKDQVTPAGTAAAVPEITRPIGGTKKPAQAPARGATGQSKGSLSGSELFDDPNSLARKRAAELVDRAREELEAGNLEMAAEAAEFALSEGERAPPPGIAEVIEPARPLFERVFESHVGPLQGVPAVALMAHEIAAMTFDHRTGFLLSRIDGSMTVEELLDVSGMGAFETFRILSSLIRAQIISVS